MHFLTPSLLSGKWEVEHALLTPSLLCGNWEVQDVLFDRISNTVSSCLVHFMIILVVFLAVDGDIARSLCNVLYQLSGVGAPSTVFF